MGLSETTVTILKACQPLLEKEKDVLGETFYKMLFKNYPEVKTQFNLSHNIVQQKALMAAVVAYCGSCDNLGPLLPVVARIAEKHVSVSVEAAQYTAVGLTLLAAMEDVLGVAVFTADVKAAVTEGYFFLADIFIAKEKTMVEEIQELQGGWAGWRQFRIVKKEEETRQHTSLHLSPLTGHLMAHKAGQYLTLRVLVPGSEHTVVRHYSISNTPGEDTYRITVKKEGFVSTYLHDVAKEGDLLEVSAPAGDFFLTPESLDSSVTQVFIGGGTGITPLLSMLTIAAASPSSKAVLIYKAHDTLSHPLSQQLFKLMATSPHISCALLYSQAPAPGAPPPQLPRHHAARDRVTLLPPRSPWTSATLANHIPSAHCKVFVCGPPGFTSASIAAVKELGVDEKDIGMETFGPMA